MKIEAKAWSKTRFWVCAVFLLAASGLKASVVITPGVNPCPASGTYQNLQTLGSCSIGNVIFGDFKITPTVDGLVNTTSSGEAAAPNASQMDFNLIDNVSGSNGQYGFDFNSFPLETLSKGSVQTASVQISYFIIDKASTETILDGGITGSDAFTLNNATATMTETYTTPSGTTCYSTVTSSSTCSFSVPGGSTGDYIEFNPQNTPPGAPANKSLTVTKVLSVSSSGSNSSPGLAHISDFGDVIDVAGITVTADPPSVPEPSFYGVLAVGLAGIFLFSKRRKKTA
jgi:hypothetical protein